MKNELQEDWMFTATDYKDEDVFEYLVYWLDNPIGWDKWNTKPFTNKKDAQRFAKKHKKKSIKPYPYIIRQITTKSAFRAEIITEKCSYDYKTITDKMHYRKLIRY